MARWRNGSRNGFKNRTTCRFDSDPGYHFLGGSQCSRRQTCYRYLNERNNSMSRSYKKWPSYSDYSRGPNGTKLNKRLASKKVRNAKDVPNYSGYKKVYESWDICDWKMDYDPWPSVYFSSLTGEKRYLYPDPLWKARRK